MAESAKMNEFKVVARLDSGVCLAVVGNVWPGWLQSLKLTKRLRKALCRVADFVAAVED